MFEQIASSNSRSCCSRTHLYGCFSYPHREGARKTMEILLGILDGEEDPGIERLLLVTDNSNFISNMKTVYRETEDQFPGSI